MQRLRELGLVLVDDAAFASYAGGDQHRLWELAVRHSVHLLLAWRIAEDKTGRWQAECRAAAREALADASVLEELQRRELTRLSAAFAHRGIQALLLKGAAWAYTLYARPALRPRDDTDLLVDESSCDRAELVLLSLGYEPAVEHVMPLASGQRHFRRVDEQGVVHPLDLHWRVTNPLVFADALPFGRLWERSVAMNIPGARTLCDVDGLLLACLHRLAHHGNTSELLWLMDIHLLATAITAEQWNEFTREAESGGLRGVCALSLVSAVMCFGTEVPTGVETWLRKAERELPERVFLGRGVSPLGLLYSDWRAIGTWKGRLRLVKDHVYPARSYMVARYRPRHPWLLPLLYGRRAFGGLRRWVMQGR